METRQIHVRDLSTVTGIQQFEHEVQSIYFLGLEDFVGTIYLSIESDDYSNEAVPLTSNTFIIGQPMTIYNTTYTCQIYGVLNDGEKIQLSKRFRLIVDKSNTIQGESSEYPIDPNFENSIIEFVTEQKSELNTYTDAQKSEIEATGDAVIASIPADYTALEQATYNAYPTESESGNPIYFDDGANDIPVKELVVNLEPKQDLNGYDHPWIGGGGINKLNIAEMNASGTAYGLTISIDGEDFIFSGTYTGTSSNPQFRFVQYTDIREIPYNCNGFAVNATTAEHYTGFIGRADSNKTLTIAFNNMVQGETYNFRVRVVAYEGDTAPTEWTPYENVRPISGYDGVTVKRTGKNLVSGFYPASSESKGITFTYIDDGEELTNHISIVGTSTESNADSPRKYLGGTRGAQILTLKSGTTYIARLYGVNGTTPNIRLFLRDDQDSAVWYGDSTNGTWTITPTTDITFMRVMFRVSASGSTVNVNGYLQIEVGNTATEYNQYTKQKYTIAFPSSVGTVYGGKLNVTTGVLTVERAKLNNSTWTIDVAGQRAYFSSRTTFEPSVSNDIASDKVICSKLPTISLKDLLDNKIQGIALSTSGVLSLHITGLTDKSSFTKEEVNTWLSDADIIYKLATPTTVQLTPTEIATLLGANTIQSDGSINLTYRADISKVIEKLTNAIISLGGNV